MDQPTVDQIEFVATTAPYGVDYIPGVGTRATTNFANLARDPANRRSNIATLLDLVDADLNMILDGDPASQRYRIALDIVSIGARIPGRSGEQPIPMTEVMHADVVDTRTGQRFPGPTGLNFSSYLRDYDFRVVLPDLMASGAPLDDFGRLHGYLTRRQFGADGVVPGPLTVGISVSQTGEYQATGTVHPILGREYTSARDSITDSYFRHMGLTPRYFRPAHLPAPIAVYSDGQLADQDDVYLAALIAVMGTFQRIYRPEIYLSRTAFSDLPGTLSQAPLSNADHDPAPLEYDREERELLSARQAHEFEERMIRPFPDVVHQLTEQAAASGERPKAR